MKRLITILLVLSMLMLVSCGGDSEIVPDATDTAETTTLDETTFAPDETTETEEKYSPEDAEIIVKNLLVKECDEIICEYDNRTHEIEGNYYHVVHAYTIGEKSVEGDMYTRFTYGWFYVDVLTGSVYTDNYDKNNECSIVPYIGDISSEEYYLTEISKANLVSIKIPNIGADELIYDHITSYLYDTCGLSEFELIKSDSVSDEFNERFKNWDYTGYYVNIEGSVSKKSDEIVSITFKGMYNYKSAAHPNHMFFAVNIDPLTGEVVAFEDKYTVNEELYTVFVKYAQEKIDSLAGAPGAISVENDLCSEDKFISGNGIYVYFTIDSIGISYEVPHVMGDHQEVEIPLTELEQFKK